MKIYSLNVDKLIPTRFSFSLILVLFCNISFAQVKKDSLFLQYLLAKDENKDAITLISQLQNRYNDSIQNQLELPFWKGMAFYSLKKLDSCTYYFSKVNPKSKFATKSLFLSGISYSYLKNIQQAEKTFKSIESKDSLMLSTRTFELAGISLLKRNFSAFDSLSKFFSEQYYPLQKQQSNFKDYQQIIKQQHRKTPLKAALLSAIIPGLGKLYVGGQIGQGVSTFLQNAILGFQAYEGLRKDGVASPRFIIYGGLFSLFYIGNIWGSAVSVKIKRQEFNDKIDDQILFDMHIPLRTIFN